MAQQGQYPLNGRVPGPADTATGVVAGATADIPLADIAAQVPIATDDTVGTVKPDGTTITIDLDGTLTALSGSGVVQSVVAGTNVTVDDTDPANPIVSATGSSGTVTSVGLSAPSQFAVTGTPVTTTGTLALAWNAQNANRLLAGPVSGGTGIPGFRALVSADLPLGTTSAPGALQPDGTTITVTGGVISSVAGGSGTVTSVGVSMPSQFAVASSPVTSTGTIAVTWNTETTNLVLASPNGSTGVPAFRALAATDLPLATTSVVGAVKPDGTTITITGGVISAVPGGSGTVTSVGLALPSTIISVSGSPVTSTGTLTGTLATQTANTVWAGAVSGGVTTPAFRALVAADIPSTIARSGANSDITSLTGLTTALTVAQGGTGAGTHTAHGVLIGEGTSAVAATAAGTAGQVLTSGGASADPGWTSPGQPYFSVYLATAQTGVTSSTFTKVLYDTVAFDPNSYWDATNHRWLPLKAGKYWVHCNVYVNGTVTVIGLAAACVYKNGVNAKETAVPSAPGGGILIAGADGIVTMNGTTDYLEGFGYLGAATTVSFQPGQSQTYFEAFYIGP